MWTCKYCGKKVGDHLTECSNCGTGMYWVPPNDAATHVDPPAVTSTHRSVPLSVETTSALTAIGVLIALVGLIAGIAILVNSPEAPSGYRSDAFTQIQRANRMTYLVLGWSQIVGGAVLGLLLYVVGGIGQAVLDLWKGQYETKQANQKIKL